MSVELLKYLEQEWCKSFSIPVPSDCKKQFSTICNDQEKFTLHCKHLDIFNIWKMCKLYQGLLTKAMGASLLILSEKIYINILELYQAFNKYYLLFVIKRIHRLLIVRPPLGVGQNICLSHS